jgi:hypothetical protein
MQLAKSDICSTYMKRSHRQPFATLLEELFLNFNKQRSNQKYIDIYSSGIYQNSVMFNHS